MQPSPNSGQPNPISTASNGYAPSVPISVYRELAAELQATKAMLDSVNEQNQHLAHHNQQLRQEVQRVVDVAMNLQRILQAGGGRSGQPIPAVDSPSTMPQAPAMAQPVTPNNDTYAFVSDILRSRGQVLSTPQAEALRTGGTVQPPIHPEMMPTHPEMSGRPMAELPNLSEEFFTEVRHEVLPTQKSDHPRDLGGVWLVFAVLAIMITAFGAGFLVMRPLVSNNR
jgi:hypothetical protein